MEIKNERRLHHADFEYTQTSHVSPRIPSPKQNARTVHAAAQNSKTHKSCIRSVPRAKSQRSGAGRRAHEKNKKARQALAFQPSLLGLLLRFKPCNPVF
jgi:thiol:disulfide interchange protein